MGDVLESDLMVSVGGIIYLLRAMRESYSEELRYEGLIRGKQRDAGK